MITVMTLVFAIVAVGGGLLGGWFIAAPLKAVAISAGVGFVVMCLAELGGVAGELPLTALFFAVTAAVGFFLKLTWAQIAAVLAGAFVVSVIFQAVLAFVAAFSQQTGV